MVNGKKSKSRHAAGDPGCRLFRGKNGGFTLIEVMVTIMVLAIILSIVGVSYARGRRVYSLKSGMEEVESALK